LSEQYEPYKVRVVQSFVQLKELTVEDIRESRVIVVSRTVFTEEEYISELANFTAMPEPPMTNRRAFNAWMTRAIEELPAQVAVYQTSRYQDFRQSTKELFEERLQQPEFNATLPVNIQHGSAYQSFSAMQSARTTSKPSKAKGKAPAKRKADTKETSHTVPLLHLFRFNRMVVDEYHYLDGSKKLVGNLVGNLIAIAVKHIAAHKRWVLSGMPALASFSDIDRIASFLGIRFGRPFLEDGTVTTPSEKVSNTDRTYVEDFLSQTGDVHTMACGTSRSSAGIP
jgi:hypothetical protein